MGTEIQLELAGIGLIYAKNMVGSDFGEYFLLEHRVRRMSEQINYDYFAENPEEDPSGMEAAFVCTLSSLTPRLALLGTTIETARAEYDALVADERRLMSEGEGSGKGDLCRYLSFEEFCAFACRYPLVGLDRTEVSHEGTNREDRLRGRFVQHDDEVSRIPGALYDDDLYWSEASYFGAKTCVLSVNAMLLVFALNPANAGAEVVWQYGPLVDAGWESPEAFQPNARRGRTVLVATEGSSDARILGHALTLLRPEVADFFRFIDVDEPHPFWGTGNLAKFAEGLVRIDVQNRVIFLLDNDAEGREAYGRIWQLRLPSNMRVMMLPDLEEFRQFPARGPEGVHLSDINGRAAAIECYLDLRNPTGLPPAQVVWSNYKDRLDTWQGALEYKETYMRRFLAQTPASISQDGYDVRGLTAVLDALIQEASRLASAMGAEGIRSGA